MRMEKQTQMNKNDRNVVEKYKRIYEKGGIKKE